MHIAQNFNSSTSHVVLTYIPARLTEGTGWYISYYCLYPPTGKLRRKKVKLNRITSITERRKIARKMMVQINQKLDSGWNPFVEEAAPKSFHLFSKCVDTYINVQRRELEQRSITSYESFIRRMYDYMKSLGVSVDIYMYQFDKNLASEIMLKIKSDKKISPRTYNNYLLFFKTLFNWFKSYNYITSNPFEGMKPMPKKLTKVTRELFTPQMRLDLKNYLINLNEHRYLAACML